ncbi:MAG: hypothetical protein JW888_02840 [Pirellulales bacterium]|nr:hypothetical protein [Pirellulales bacterium]
MSLAGRDGKNGEEEGAAGRASVVLATERIAHLLANLASFADSEVFETLALPIDMLVDLDDRLLHGGMRLFRPTDEGEVLSASEPYLPVIGIEPNAEHSSRFSTGVSSLHEYLFSITSKRGVDFVTFRLSMTRGDAEAENPPYRSPLEHAP